MEVLSDSVITDPWIVLFGKIILQRISFDFSNIRSKIQLNWQVNSTQNSFNVQKIF